MAETIKIAGELESTATGNVVAAASAIKDKVKNKYQGEINAETDATLANHASAINGLNTQNYVTVTATDQTTAATDVLPPSGSVDTVYRVGNWDGTQYDETCYSEYSWNGSAYVHISTKTQIGEVFDISAYHATGGVLTKYADLAAALDSNNGGGVPESLQKGGMSVKFVQSSDNNYIQYLCKAASFSTNPADWEKVNNVSVSQNTLTIGGEYKGELAGQLIETPEWVWVVTTKDKHILLGFNKSDGSPYFGYGCPPQVIKYIENVITVLQLDTIPAIREFLGEFLGSTTLINLLNTKVSKEPGKSLINETYAESVRFVENHEYSKVIIDAEKKLIEAITKLGNKVIFGNLTVKGDAEHQKTKTNILEIGGVKDTIIESFDYSKVITDAEKRLIEAIKKNGIHRFNVGIEFFDGSQVYGGKSNDYGELKKSKDGVILESVSHDGKKYISEMDSHTVGLSHTLFSIPIFNKDFSSLLPCDITGTKGDEFASYILHLELLRKSWNIRFKFKITENILNSQKKVSIAKLINNRTIISNIVATPIRLSQYITTAQVNGETKTMMWPTLTGGVRLVNQEKTLDTWMSSNDNLGDYALSIRYTGTATDATIENTGSALILKVNGSEIASLSYSTYSKVSELYAALKNISDFDVSIKSSEEHYCHELAIFPECQLVSTFYGEDTSLVFVNDKAPFFIPYAINDNWHQVEIIRIDDKVYYCCDGCPVVTVNVSNIITPNYELILGGECGVLFKDLEIDTESCRDAEIVEKSTKRIISSVNPSLFVMMGHGIFKGSTEDAIGSGADVLTCSTDRLNMLFSTLKKKGYVPVGIKEIENYFARDNFIPKRAFAIIFDDFRYSDLLQPSIRKIFEQYSVPAVLAVYNKFNTVDYNSSTITTKDASIICLANGFELYSHTRNHRNLINVQPSLYITEFLQDVYSGDEILVNCSSIIYPGGRTNLYVYHTLKWLGCAGGYRTSNDKTDNSLCTSKYEIWRYDIGIGESLDNIINAMY